MANRSALVAIGMLLVPISAEANSPRAADSVAIRVYDVLGASTSELKDARATAEAILRDASIEASWRQCRFQRGAASTSEDSCRDELMPGELVVRIVSAPATWREGSLGFSYVNEESRRGTLATVFGDRIRPAAARWRMSVGRLLGRVIAHEVGHLLLGTLRHSETGLMREVWTRDLVRSGKRHDWLFSAPEALEMRRLLVVRAGLAEAHVARLRDAPTP